MKIRSYSKGFTLVEMAVVVVILGLMAALILPGIFKTIERNRLERGRAGIEALKNEVIGYARATANKVLPELIEGFRHERDPWGNRADYHFDPALTTASICDASSTQLSIQRAGSSAIADIAFVVVSSGKNMNFETTPSPPSTTLPYTVIYHDLGVQDASFPGYEFDDIIAFVSLNELKGSVCNTPASSATPPGNPAVHLTFDTALDVADPLIDAFGTGASTVTMADGTGIGDVLALDGTQNQNFVRITPPSTDAEDYCEYTVMGWFRTQNPTQAPTNRMQIITSRRPNIGGFVNTWAVGVNKPEEPRTGNDEPRHPLGEAFWAASGVDVGRNLIRMHTSLSDGTDEFPTPRPTSSSGALPPDYATKRALDITHLDDRWHFFAVNFEAGGTSSVSGGTCSPGATYTARMYISDHNADDPAAYVDANYELFSRQATGLTAGPDVSYGDATSYRIYLGQLALNAWSTINLFEGYIDEFLLYLRGDVVVQGDDPLDPSAKSAHDYIVEWYDATRCSYVQNAPGCP